MCCLQFGASTGTKWLTKYIFYFAPIFRSKQICPSYKQLAPSPQRINSAPRGGPQFENLWNIAYSTVFPNQGSTEHRQGFVEKSWSIYMSRASSGSIVSDYGLDDRAIEVRSLAEAKGFFL
jgi:hypothetical protein